MSNNKKAPELTSDYVLQEIEKANKIIADNSKSNDQDTTVALFWGKTGVGKSTACNFFRGQQMLAYSLEGVPLLIQKYPTQNGPKSQQSISAGTIYPTVVQFKNNTLWSKKIMLWDMPGLNENRGVTQALINNYFIHKIFRLYTKVKLIFAIDYDIIRRDKKGLDIPETLNHMADVLGDFNDYYEGVTIMVTKVPIASNNQNILQLFKQHKQHHYPKTQQQQLNKKKQLPKQNYKVILQLIANQKISFFIIKSPSININEIILKENAINITSEYQQQIQTAFTKISQLKPVPITKINTAMNQQQKQKCQPIIKDIQIRIVNIINTIKMQLMEYINEERLNLFNESQKIQKDEQDFRRFNKMTQFMEEINTIISKNQQNGKTEQNFTKLNQIFKKYNFFSLSKPKNEKLKNQKPQCNMKKLENESILIDFLSSTLIDNQQKNKQKKMNKNLLQFRWDSSIKVKQQLFRLIKSINLQQTIQRQNLVQFQMLKKFMKYQFKEKVLQNLQNQALYIQWKQQYKKFPYFMEQINNLNYRQNPAQYYKNLAELFLKNRISSVSNITKITKRLNNFNQYINKPNFTEINSQINKLIQQKSTKLINQCIKQTQFAPQEQLINLYNPDDKIMLQNIKFDYNKKIKQLQILQQKNQQKSKSILQLKGRQQALVQYKKKKQQQIVIILTKKQQQINNLMKKYNDQIKQKQNYKINLQNQKKTLQTLKSKYQQLDKQKIQTNQINKNLIRQKNGLNSINESLKRQINQINQMNERLTRQNTKLKQSNKNMASQRNQKNQIYQQILNTFRQQCNMNQTMHELDQNSDAHQMKKLQNYLIRNKCVFCCWSCFCL